MKLFDFPGSCSTGIHALLEESGASYELEVVDLASFAQKSAGYASVNPKGKVPALLRMAREIGIDLPANLDACLGRLSSRPAFATALSRFETLRNRP